MLVRGPGLPLPESHDTMVPRSPQRATVASGHSHEGPLPPLGEDLRPAAQPLPTRSSVDASSSQELMPKALATWLQPCPRPHPSHLTPRWPFPQPPAICLSQRAHSQDTHSSGGGRPSHSTAGPVCLGWRDACTPCHLWGRGPWAGHPWSVVGQPSPPGHPQLTALSFVHQ